MTLMKLHYYVVLCCIVPLNAEFKRQKRITLNTRLGV